MARLAIVGAGPAGATLAYLLACRGLDVTLLERRADFAREFRGEGLMPSGVEVFHQMGLGAALDALPQARFERVEVFLNARPIGDLTDLALHLRNNLHAVTHPFLLDAVRGLLQRWSMPGMLLLGDASHTMSPVGGKGINLALRDAVVAANHLCEAAAVGEAAGAERWDAAARAIEAERLPEIVTIQKMQQRPPRVLLGHCCSTRAGSGSWAAFLPTP